MRAALALGVVLLGVVDARAEGDPIAVVTDDRGFRSAIERALAPAGMTILPIAGVPAPPTTELADASRAIADREHASATVWLVAAPTGATLVAYDRDVDRVLVRELPFAPPLDAAQAAQAARMARTMLRALRVTPDTDQLPPRATEAPVVRERVRALTVESAITPRPPRLAIELDGGVRLRGPGERAAFAGAVALAWRPDALGIAVMARFATATELDDPGIDARIGDASLAVLARLALHPSARWTVAGAAGLALHHVHLEGNLAGMPVADRAFDPAVRVGVTATMPLAATGVRLGVAMWADALLRRQIYDAGDRTVLTVPLVQAMAGVIVSARIL